MKYFKDYGSKHGFCSEVIESIDGIYELSELPYIEQHSRFTVKHSNVKFECFFNRNNNSKKLYVFFSGGRDKNEVKFFRWSWYSFIDGSMLNIDDPMYQFYGNIGTAFYYGTRDVNFRSLVCDIVSKFVDDYGFDEVIFYGSSAGGSAALQCACLYEGSQAIAINPQIKLSIDYAASKFEKVTGFSLEEDTLGRNNVLEQVRESKSTFVIAENLASKRDDMQRDLLSHVYGKSCDAIGVSRLSDNCVLWNYYIDMGDEVKNHQMCDFDTIFGSLTGLSECLHANTLNQEVIDSYRVITDLWRDNAYLKNDLDKFNKTLDEYKVANIIKIFADSAAELYIFGAGAWGIALASYCEKMGVNITGFIVDDGYIEATKKKTTLKVKGLSQIADGDKVIIASAQEDAFKSVIGSGVQYHTLPEWFFREIAE